MKRSATILEQYILAATEHGEATRAGDSRNANRQYAKLTKFYQQLAVDISFSKDFLSKLFRHSNPCVRLWAAAHALGLGIETKEAAYILKQLADDQSIGMVRLDAEMTFKEWMRTGKLSF